MDILLEELKSSELVDLPSDFYLSLQSYIQELKLKMDKGSKVESELAQAELKIISEIIEVLICLRMRKMLRKLASGATIKSGLLEAEVTAFRKISSAIDELLSTARKYVSLEESLFAKKILVRFIREVPAFVGVDLKTYGPFKPEDLAYIPAVNAEALAKRNVVELLEG